MGGGYLFGVEVSGDGGPAGAGSLRRVSGAVTTAETVSQGVAGGFDSVRQAHLPVDVLQMALHGSFGKVELSSDFSIGGTGSHQSQDLGLPAGQAVGVRAGLRPRSYACQRIPGLGQPEFIAQLRGQRFALAQYRESFTLGTDPQQRPTQTA